MNQLPSTPGVVIDSAVMERNIAAMAEVARKAGVQLRPHAKTHKMPWIALRQIEAGAAGITVAKVSEAEVMAAHGVKDIFIAYPLVTPDKIERALKLSAQIRLIVGVDSREGALRLAQAAAAARTRLEVRLEIDTGLRRTGVLYEKALELGRFINSLAMLRLTGIYTFRGALMGGKPTLDLQAAGEEEGRLMAELAGQMRGIGLPIDAVSVGSTPTAAFAAAVPGVTEVRPGTYVFQDRMQARLGVCGLEDCAGRVRVTVISRPSVDLAVIDGGSKTFATDVQPNTDPLQLRGFGHIAELPDAVLERLSEEHGMLRLGPEAQHSPLAVGDILHIIPNHICSTVNLHNQVYMLRDGKYEPETVLGRGKLE
ncbi:D-serine deaminase, pyridoxal phosphate-dependent [Paenibacillus sp. UNCCL117]|uniref:alanine racemase n=1 Tax=unclassified Paenibacillus TaxID=185978 RepID=UPI000883BA62|nr:MULTISPECIES: alanine racemase [unclassified Paenibacillus]SDD63233.1 D-serine deaminase, pyridoxal phosphate-dependent [Paenibacillus sp. cl123]SFW67754.1 D-serine deaminase, pyridoxal phosphate-dependent [Paenibacillus sp. UNCCL117]